MTIEQRSELNRFVDPSIPLSWNWRWRQLKLTLPILAFIWACLLEAGIFRAWLADRLDFHFILILLAVCLFFPVFILGLAESQVRIRQRSKRVVQFKENKIIVKPAKSGLVLWKRVAKFQFEPIPETPGLTKLKVFLRGRPNKQPSGWVFWAMVLENPSQVQELVRYLQSRKTETPAGYEIEILWHPVLPENSARFPFLGTSLYMGGFYLLLHGVPALIVLLNRNHHDSDGGSKFTPQETAKLGQFIVRHFSSREEFHHFFQVFGISLTVAGVVLLILGWRQMNRKAPVVPPSRSARGG